MHGTLLNSLGPIRHRRRLKSATAGLLAGLVVGSIVCGAMMLARPARGQAPWALAALLAGPLVGAAAGFFRRASWSSTATLVDDHFGLKDSVSSALEFSTDPGRSSLADLQVRRVAQRLGDVKAPEVVSLRVPRSWPVALISFVAAVGLVAWPLVSPPGQAQGKPPTPFGPALEEAHRLEADLRAIEEDARKSPDPSLDAMIARMKQTIEELKAPGITLRETMAALSSLEEALSSQRTGLDVNAAERELKDLGEALNAAEPLEPAGRAIQEAQFERAAQALEKSADAPIDEREAGEVERRAGKTADKMKSKGLDGLGKATREMAKGVKQGGEARRQGTGSLAKEIREHERRRRINRLLAQEQERLKECKDRCEARNLAERQRKEQEQPAAPKPASSAGGPPPPSSSQGKNDSVAKTADEKAQLDRREKLQGLGGEGPSEREDVKGTTEDGPKSSRRPSKKVVQKYRQLSEAALAAEPIPMGYRRAIRRYFELIRPATDPSDEPEATPTAPKP